MLKSTTMRTIFLSFLTSALIISCQYTDKNESDNKKLETNAETIPEKTGPAAKLEGAWEIKRAEGDMRSVNEGTVYEFKGSKLSFGKGGFKNPGSTVITDTTFSFQADGNEYKFMYNYKFNGDTLVVEMQNSGGQIFHMVKK